MGANYDKYQGVNIIVRIVTDITNIFCTVIIDFRWTFLFYRTRLQTSRRASQKLSNRLNKPKNLASRLILEIVNILKRSKFSLFHQWIIL